MAIKKKVTKAKEKTEDKLLKITKSRAPKIDEPKIDEAYVFQAFKGHCRMEHRPKKPHNKKARDKAARLLWSHLDTFQREQLITHGYFDIQKGRVKFRVHSGWNYNLEVCVPAHPDPGAFHFLGCHIFDPPPPMGDLILAQKLLVESRPDSLIGPDWGLYLDMPAKV